mmetsp:Transcript_9922/g.14943  ORF Transcript_9922/g.14943 Transcript_9922/m.14943 type:complete len:81 (+) Transcript_9922:97-339(+)
MSSFEERAVRLNPHLIRGQVNGLTYYILPNERPDDKIELRLIVNVGSLMESESERGLAHFIEHLGFKGGIHSLWYRCNLI